MALTGCTSLPPSVPPVGPHLSGRLAVQVEGDSSRSFSADFDLQGTAETGQLRLSSALGTSLAEARWTPVGIQLQTPDGQYRFANLTELADQAIGEPIPLAALIDWLQARPWPAAPSSLLDPAQPARGFRQLDWIVQLDRYPAGLVLATRQSPTPTIRVRAKLDTPTR